MRANNDQLQRYVERISQVISQVIDGKGV